MCVLFTSASARALLSFHHLSSLAGQRQWQQDETTDSVVEWNELGDKAVFVYLYEGMAQCAMVLARPLFAWFLSFTFDVIVTFMTNMLTH